MAKIKVANPIVEMDGEVWWTEFRSLAAELTAELTAGAGLCGNGCRSSSPSASAAQ